MVRVKITRNFQITIPASVRSKLGLKEGEEVDVHLDEGGRILIEKLSEGRKVLKAGRKLLPDEIEKIIEEGLVESIK